MSIILQRMLMRHKIAYPPGFLPIFPNYHHQDRRDGFGCASLSPMNLGPIEFDLPTANGKPQHIEATCLENFWQGNKLFDIEADAVGNPTSRYYEKRDEIWADPMPHRHKYNTPATCLGFPWHDEKGADIRLGYVEARKIYCTYYEALAELQPDYKTLVAWHECGKNLMICGYDAYPMDTSMNSIYKAYNSPDLPFGHERVLMTMLSYPHDKRPWHTN